MAALPPTPLYEADGFDASAIGDEATRVFAEALRRDGVAAIDLGDAARALCERAVEETEPYFTQKGAKRVQDAWRRSPAVRRLATLPIIRDRLTAAYGRAPFAFQTLNFQRGTQQELHSDLIHFSSLPERFMCGVWIALEDIEPDSGPLAYVPGSHRLATLTMRDAGVAGRSRESDYGRYVDLLAERIAHSNLPRRELVIPKGWAFVWAANLVHGGSAITNPGSTRRSLVVHHYFEDCLYFTPLLSDVEGGRLCVRLPADIGTGRFRWSRRNGRAVLPSPGTALDTLLGIAIRRPHVQ